MPELPEVQGYKTYIDSTSLDKTITAFECRDNRLLKQPLKNFEDNLIGQQLIKTHRIGKYLFIKTSGEKILVLHFGMTGRPNYYKENDDRPKFGHIVLTFENGFHFAFENKRKFGWWDLIDSIEDFQSLRNLSDDARDLTLDVFSNSFSTRKTGIKKILMDQSIAAGVGNWMADDILYQARVHPNKKVQDMSADDIKRVFDAMKNVIEIAIECDAHYEDFPDYFFIHIRKESATCFHTGDDIKKIKVGGRTTYFSAKWQKL